MRSFFLTAGRLAWLGILLAGLLAGCRLQAVDRQFDRLQTQPDPLTMANPAASYCQEQGGRHVIITLASGDQSGDCIFPDGSGCEAWAFFRGECRPGEQGAAMADPAATKASEDPAPTRASGSTDEMAQAAWPVVAWVGHIASLPTGAEYDDFVEFYPEGAGSSGIAGINPELETLIHALRDGRGVQEAVFIWGSLQCGVPDYASCQVLATDLEYGQVQMDPIEVDGWEGSLVCAYFNPSPEASCRNAFALSGPFAVQYGIWSPEASIRAQLDSLRDSGDTVKVWGHLLVGVPDVNGSQIQVDRLEISAAP